MNIKTCEELLERPGMTSWHIVLQLQDLSRVGRTVE